MNDNNNKFNINYWRLNSYKLTNKFPQLTSADLIWRHQTQEELYRSIAETLGIRKKELEEIIASL